MQVTFTAPITSLSAKDPSARQTSWKEAPMGLFSFLARGSSLRIDRLALEVARRSHNALWQRVERRAGGMKLAEARGYVRARAAQVIHAQTDEVLADHRTVDKLLRSEVITQATRHVIRLVMGDLVRRPSRGGLLRKAA